jgi:hypothetical protein
MATSAEVFETWMTELRGALGKASITEYPPFAPTGVYIADIACNGMEVCAQFHPSFGYGLSKLGRFPSFNSRPDALFHKQAEATEALKRFLNVK